MSSFEIKEFERIYNDLYFVVCDTTHSGLAIIRAADMLRNNHICLRQMLPLRWAPIFIGSESQCEVVLENTKLNTPKQIKTLLENETKSGNFEGTRNLEAFGVCEVLK